MRIEGVLRPHVRPRERCALIDFPHYSNVGDSAIWLGERAILAQLGARVAYTADPDSFRAARMRSDVGGGRIFIQGGGNLGDLWPRHQAFREHVVETFRDTPIVQLPQSIHFESRENLDRARRVFNAHPRLTLMVRDRRSMALAQTEFSAEVVLCPDMAFALGPLRRTGRPSHDVVSVIRHDKETVIGCSASDAAEGHVADWGLDDWWTSRWGGRVRRLLSPDFVGYLWPHAVHVCDALARWRLRRGIRILSRGRVAVTDRLHGHILCVLLGIPHVALDNSYGKVSSFIETWTSGLPQVKWAESPQKAAELLRELTRDRRS